MDRPTRKPNRLRNYDYSAPGAYFLTICTHEKRCLLSRIPTVDIRHVLQAFKSITTVECHKSGICSGPLWQRSYHDHIIRDEADHRRIAEYIETNPARWTEDCFYFFEP